MIIDQQPYYTKLISKGYKYPVTILKNGNRLWFSFPFNRGLLEEVKCMQGAKWHGYEDEPIKQWSIEDNARNRFQLAYLEGHNPYAPFETPLIDYKCDLESFRNYQTEMTAFGLTRHYCIWAAEMGTGKTLSAIKLMEASGHRDWFYVAPKSALVSVQLEFEKWQSKVMPEFMTYEGLKKILQNWPSGQAPPHGVIGDEISRCKNPTAQRTQAMMHLCDSIRTHWGMDGYVILMSGTPAPKSPLDWWSLANLACPGFLKEGSLEKFRKRLGIMKEGKSETGGVFAQLVSWYDDEKKCKTCGKFENDPDHDSINMAEPWFHAYEKSINEVEMLYKRMDGLVLVKTKKECLRELPDKIFKIIRCKPNQSIINAAKLITATGESTIKTLTLLRELSDGFQYEKSAVGTEICLLCKGNKSVLDWQYIGPDDQYEEICERQTLGQDIPPGMFEKVERACSYCNGTGESIKYMREAIQVPCPKEDALADIIDQHDDIGRLVTYAGFTGSVDRVVQIYLKAQWDVIRVDGRGWWSNLPGDNKSLLRQFYGKEGRVGFVGQPDSAGLGLNLTSSPTCVCYSNSFNYESRAQCIDRIHRLGMDVNKGATIIDLVHLPTDELVLENLNKKRKLQDMSLGLFADTLNRTDFEVVR